MQEEKIIAEGGFNTGRLYTRHGQRIYWWQLEGGDVLFSDRDRMIDGEIEAEAAAGPINPNWLMAHYDRHNYRMGCFTHRPPADFDFGPMLRI